MGNQDFLTRLESLKSAVSDAVNSSAAVTVELQKIKLGTKAPEVLLESFNDLQSLRLQVFYIQFNALIQEAARSKLDDFSEIFRSVRKNLESLSVSLSGINSLAKNTLNNELSTRVSTLITRILGSNLIKLADCDVKKLSAELVKPGAKARQEVRFTMAFQARFNQGDRALVSQELSA